MQPDILKNTSTHKQKQYLRVAAIDSRSNYCFLYIGSDSNTINFLSDNFTSGFIAKDFNEAKHILGSKSALTDIIIIDLLLEDDTELKALQSFIINRGLVSIPVVCNCFHPHNKTIFKTGIIDDVIDLYNWQYDFATKVSFLKKSKNYRFKNSNRARIKVAMSTWACYYTKRFLDITIASILLILLFPLLVLIALAIKLESKGPILYNSKRAGRGFKIFNFYKFRTMCVNADKKIESLSHLNQYEGNEKAMFFKISNDPRITKAGKLLRNTSLDELPQLFNVIKGDMSLVGNRPLPLYEAATLTTNEFVERFMAPAGMTGLWQIKKRGQTEMSVEERISLDISYARNSSLLYDLWIMVNTPGALIQKSNV